MTSFKDDARFAAWSVLNHLGQHTQTLDAVMDDVRKQFPHLNRRDEAFFNTLVYGVTRNRKRLDWIISHFSTTKLNKIDPKVLNILRMGIYQLAFLDRVPDSAAVNTSVQLVKCHARPWVVRFVNAVLRNAARNGADVPLPDSKKDPVNTMAVAHSFPEWLISRWIKRFGATQTQALCEFFNTIPPVTVRTNTLKTTRETLMRELAEEADRVSPTRYSPKGISITGMKVPIANMKPFMEGKFQVQDEAAQMAGHLLAPQPGHTILDACAGLGGKTGHIAQLMRNSGRVIAVDRDEKKLDRLEKEMRRLGISIVHAVPMDLTAPINDRALPLFDGIFIDAPCSGLGVVRRNPDTKWRVQPDDLNRLAKVQTRLLKNLSDRLKPGGAIVYTVCTLEPEETVKVIDAFIKEHPEFTVDADRQSSGAAGSEFSGRRGFFKTIPHVHFMDGFFSARLINTSS